MQKTKEEHIKQFSLGVFMTYRNKDATMHLVYYLRTLTHFILVFFASALKSALPKMVLIEILQRLFGT